MEPTKVKVDPTNFTAIETYGKQTMLWVDTVQGPTKTLAVCIDGKAIMSVPVGFLIIIK